jgi:hypothetical protein
MTDGLLLLRLTPAHVTCLQVRDDIAAAHGTLSVSSGMSAQGSGSSGGPSTPREGKGVAQHQANDKGDRHANRGVKGKNKKGKWKKGKARK